MKTLIVHYLPREDYSHTGKILAAFKEKIKGEVKDLDLLKDIPDYFDTARVLAYIHQNYLGTELEPETKALLSKMERFAHDVKEADIVVLATPMYNYSYPALVKAWFDSVMFKGITWDAGPDGYYGLSADTRAALLFASGGSYTGESAGWDHLTPIVAQSFAMMGRTDFSVVTAGGINQGGDVDKIVADAQAQARTLAESWYI